VPIPAFRAFLHRLLASRGYLLSRMEPAIPPSVQAYLKTVVSRTAPPASIICLDNEVSIQTEILKVAPEGDVQFSSPILQRGSNTLATGSVLPSMPSGRFVAVIDIEAFPLQDLVTKISWLQQADTILLRARLGSFWGGELDFCQLQTALRALDYALKDVIDFPRLSPAQMPSGRVIFACEREKGSNPQSPHSRYRVNEAATYLSSPIVHHRDFVSITGRGSFGFAGGIFNPGAIFEQGQTYLLPRSDRIPWVLQKTAKSHFFASAKPMLLPLGADHQVTSATELSINGLPDPASNRAEDFRLFRFKDQVFTNHSVISDLQPDSGATNPVRLETMQIRVGLSKLDVATPQLIWQGFLGIDRPLTQTEKNWAMFADSERLFLLYSFFPYILLSAKNWPRLEFTTLFEDKLTLPIDGDGLPIRNSINPIDYDDDHWLHIVHKVYPGKQYAFWAVLIDRKTLRPSMITRRPLVRGWHSALASIIYTCSATVDTSHVHLFSGLDDSSTAIASITRTRLNGEWIPVNR